MKKLCAAEHLDITAGGGLRLLDAALGDQRRHLAPPAAGEGDEPLGMGSQHVRLDGGPALLVGEVGVREEAAEVGVAPLRLAEEGQVMARLAG